MTTKANIKMAIRRLPTVEIVIDKKKGKSKFLIEAEEDKGILFIKIKGGNLSTLIACTDKEEFRLITDGLCLLSTYLDSNNLVDEGSDLSSQVKSK